MPIENTILVKMIIKYILRIAFYGILMLFLVSATVARPFRLDKLPDKGENFGCLTCHVGHGGPLNPFGQDYKKFGIEAGDIYTEELGKMESDGDGFINDDEFLAKTNPGNQNSKPAKIAESETDQTDSKPQDDEIRQDKVKEPETKADSVRKGTDAEKESKIGTPEKQVETSKLPEQKKIEASAEIPVREDAISQFPATAVKASGIKRFDRYSYLAGRYFALAGFILILIQYVLSSKIKSIEKFFGLDKLFIIHRKIGLLGLIIILLHPAVLLIYSGFFSYNLILKSIGALALFGFLLSAGAAILYAKLHLKYESWKNIHRINYFILPIAFLHSIFLGSDLYQWSWLKILWFILAGIYLLILIYKLWNWLYIRQHPYKVTDVVRETHDVTSLYFEKGRLDYKPGQFMIINLDRNGKVSESHPFTISSSPTRDKLSISVKSVGDFTSTIGNTKPSDLAYIDAPYGRFSFLNHDAKNIVFIAGGIGITPFISALRYIYDEKLDRNITLIWANKTEDDIAFKDELEKMANEMLNLKIIHVMSKQDDWPGEKGYIDDEKIKRLVSNIHISEFFICGPPIMMTLVEKELRGLGVPQKRIHYEKFSLR